MKGSKLVNNELNIMNIIKTLQKLKAAVQVLVKKKDIQSELIEEQFLHHVAIYSDSDEEVKNQLKQGYFQTLIERDEK